MAKHKKVVVPIPTTLEGSIPDEDRFECEECGRMFDKETGLSIHLARVHGWKKVKEEPKNGRKQICRLSFAQRMKLHRYLEENKVRIEEKRLTKDEICGEYKEFTGLDITQAHINPLSADIGIVWARGHGSTKIIKTDTQTLVTFALCVQELFARLGEEPPKILVQLKEQLQSELRKEKGEAPETDGTE